MAAQLRTQWDCLCGHQALQHEGPCGSCGCRAYQRRWWQVLLDAVSY